MPSSLEEPAQPSHSRTNSNRSNRSSSSSRVPVPSLIPVIPIPVRSPSPSPSLPTIETEHTINFHRRPSASSIPEPVTSRSRDLVPPLPSVLASPNPNADADDDEPASPSPSSRRHSRNDSISLASPTQTQPTPSPPIATRTRAPLDSFASMEMLQGQRSVEEKRRGSEVWGEMGRYEGRGVAGVGLGYQPRRTDPNEHMRQARNSQSVPVPSHPTEADLASIASQLRSHDNRRESVDDPSTSYSRRASTGGAPGPSPTSILMPSLSYSFPARPTISAPYVLDSISDSSNSDDGYDLGVDESPSYNPYSSSTEKLSLSRQNSLSSSTMHKSASGGQWRTEILEGSAVSASYGATKHRPSIVALPVYPAPSGSLAKSWKFKRNLKKFGVGASWVTLAASLGATWVYLVKRSEGMAAVEAQIPGRFWVGWVMISVELIIAVIVGIQAVWDVVTFRSTSHVPKLRLRGDKNLPSVDVFIVASGQPDQTTFDCAVAAASMDYAAHRFRVMVLDPTGSAILERDITKHAKSQGCPHLTYHRRQLFPTLGDDCHSRAGSVNFGAKEASSFGIKGPGEFIVVFEADVIPERNFLRAALPAVLSNAKVGLVKTGHGFINLPLRLSQATSTLIEAAEPSSDSRSGFILRRSAFTEIGGFPSGSWLPDGHLEALLRGKGFEAVAIDEVLQWGMARPTYGAQVNQMMINRLGPLRTAAKLRFYCGGEQIRLMAFGARVRGMWRALQPVFSLVVLLLTVAYPFMFTYGGLLILTPNLASLNALLLSCLIMLITASLHDLTWTWSTGLPSPRRKLQAWVFSAPYEAVALLRLLLPTWVGGYSRGSDMDLTSVADPQRPSLWKRIGWLVIDPHSDVIFAFAASIGVTVWRATRDHAKGTVDVHQTALTILLTVAWPSFVWIDLIYGSLVPYTCLLFPSHLLTARREIFVIRDTYSSIARPKHAFKTARPFKVNRFPQVLTAVILLGWSIAAVVIGTTTDIFT